MCDDKIRKTYFNDEEWYGMDEELQKAHRNLIALNYNNYIGTPKEIRVKIQPHFMKTDENEEVLAELISEEEIKKEITDENSNIEPSYYNDEEPNKPQVDRHMFCEDCVNAEKDICPHWSITDTPVPVGTENRARKTIPLFLKICKKGRKAFGVFANSNVPQGVQMGPYVGNLTKVPNSCGYSWKMNKYLLEDKSDETQSNWMRYVNCARSYKEQNLVAFQNKGEIYFRTNNVIPAGKELLIYYGKNFVTRLGGSTEMFFYPDLDSALENKLVCPYCFIGLNSHVFLDIHIRNCGWKRKIETVMTQCNEFLCPYCHINYTTKHNFENHTLKCRRKTRRKLEKKQGIGSVYSCKYCSFKTQHKSSLQRHEESMHYGVTLGKSSSNKKFNCPKCEFKTRFKNNLQVHLRTHNKAGFIRCIFCVYVTNEKKTYYEHLLRKHGEMDVEHFITFKIHRCQYCDYRSCRKYDFSFHLLKHDKTNAKTYTCNECHHTTFKKCDLIKHVRLHKKLFPYHCTFCHQKFNEKHSVDSHLLSKHWNEKNVDHMINRKIYSCDFCLFKCLKRQNYLSHIQSHKNKNKNYEAEGFTKS